MITSMIILLYLTTTSHTIEDDDYYTAMTTSLAQIHNSDCVNFITESTFTESQRLQRVVTYISRVHQIYTNIFDFEGFKNLSGRESQCLIPFNVVFADDECTHKALLWFANRISIVTHFLNPINIGLWLIFLPSLKPEDLEQFFDEIEIPFHSQVLVAKTHWENMSMEVRDIYRITPNSPLRYPLYGYFTTKGIIEPIHDGDLYLRRHDFEGLNLKVSYMDNPPLAFSKVVDNKTIVTGFFTDVWTSLEKYLNFTSTFRRESSWEGFSYNMYGNGADVGFIDFGMNVEDFLAILSFSSYLLHSTLEVYYQDPGPSINVYAQFLPLSLEMWLTIFAWFILAALILHFGCFLSDRNLDTEENMTMANSALLVVGALCAQGTVDPPRSYSCRALFMATFLITAVIIPSYSASLSSYLTILPTYKPFQDLKEFYQMNKMTMLVKRDSHEYFSSFVSYKISENLHKIAMRDFRNGTLNTTNDGLMKICSNQNMALLGIGAIINYQYQELQKNLPKTCRLVSLRLKKFPVQLGFSFPVDSQLQEAINRYLVHITSNGVISRLRHRYWPMNKIPKSDNEYTPVGLINVFMVFVVLGVGVILALTIFIIECIVHEFSKENNKLKNQGKRQGKFKIDY